MWTKTEFTDFLTHVFAIIRDAGHVQILLCVLILVLSVAYLWFKRYEDFPPGPRGYPFIGNLKLLQDKPHIHLTNLKEQYGDVYSLKLGKYKAIVACSLSGVEEGLANDTGLFIGRPDIFSSKLLFSGDRNGGICFSEIDLKYKMKKDFVLKSIDNICCESKQLVDVIATETERIVYFMLSQDKGCDVKYAIESTMLRIMMYVVNGKLYEPNDENFMEIWQTFQMRNELCGDRWSLFVPFLNRLQQHKNVNVWERIQLQFEYQRNIVNRHKDEFNPKIVTDMIDHMLVMLEGNEDMGVLDQADLDLLFVEMSGSGYRAMSATLLWLLLYMATFPDIQKKVYEELVTVVGKGRLPRLSDQPYLPYTSAVILETHRLATVMPFLYPHKALQESQFMGYKITADTILLFNVWSIHHDPRYWKHPMKFDPTRFLADDGSLYIPDHFLPFGDGIRGCPGESLADIQLFLFSTHLLHQLNFTTTSEPDLDGIYKGYLVTPKPYKLNIAPRETTPSCFDPEVISSSTEDISCDMHTVISLFSENVPQFECDYLQ